MYVARRCMYVRVECMVAYLMCRGARFDYPCYDPIDRTEGAYFSSLVYRDEAEREAFLD